MSKLKKLLMFIFLLPLMPLMGVASAESDSDVDEGVDVDDTAGDADDTGDDTGDDSEDEEDDAEEEQQKTNKKNKGRKTFTQKQVTSMMAKEKKEGRNAGINSVLKQLGFKTLEEAKNAVNKKQSVDRDAQEYLNAIAEKKAAEDEVKRYKEKFTLITMGFDASDENIEDALSLINARVNEETSFEEAAEIVKEKHKALLSTTKAVGTGSSFKPSKPNTGEESYGKKLAAVSKNKTTKNPYF